MSDTKISDLPAATSGSDGHEFAVNETGTSRKVTLAQMEARIMLSPTIYSPIVSSGTYTYPVETSGTYIIPTIYTGTFYSGIYTTPSITSGIYNTGTFYNPTVNSGTFISPTVLYLQLESGSANSPPIVMRSGLLTTAVASGALEYDGTTFYANPVLGSRGVCISSMFRVLTGNYTGQSTTNLQPWFEVKGAVKVESGVSYYFEGGYSSERSAGTAFHGVNLAFGGTARATGIGYFVSVKGADGNVASATSMTGNYISIQVTGSTAIKVASISATENVAFSLWGWVWFASSGTFQPQYQYTGNAPGGSPTIERGTYFLVQPMGPITTDFIGPWST